MDSFGIASCNFGVLVVSEFVDLMALLSMLKPSQPKARKVYENCSRSVVKISTVRLAWDDYRQSYLQVPGFGSGFVWDRNLRLLVTCDHVIHDVSEISITLEDESDGIIYKAEVVFSDRERDVAVLRVDAPKEKLWPVAAGDSDTVGIGDEVCAIGAPFGYQNSLSTGVISGVKREVHPRGRRPLQGLLQTNAALNPGNSGGPLFDNQGKVIGMNTCINASPSGTSTGVGFASPVNVISEIIDKTVKVKPANNTRPNSGIELRPYHSGESHIDNVDFVNGSCVGAKLKDCHSHHNHDDVIGYLARRFCRRLEGFDIFSDLAESGQAKMRNGDVLVCRGYCEECQKMDLDILPSDHVDKFGVGRTHPTVPVERRRRWRRQMRRYQAWLDSAIDTPNDHYDERWETSEKNGPSYQFRSISGNKSVPYRSVDQLHTFNDVNDQVERYEEVKRPILKKKFAPFGSFEWFDASQLLDLYHLSPTNDPSGKVDLQESQLLEELLKSFICCCPATSSRKPVSCTQAGTSKSSNPGSSCIKCC